MAPFGAYFRGGRAEGLACADPGARTPIGVSGNLSSVLGITYISLTLSQYVKNNGEDLSLNFLVVCLELETVESEPQILFSFQEYIFRFFTFLFIISQRPDVGRYQGLTLSLMGFE